MGIWDWIKKQYTLDDNWEVTDYVTPISLTNHKKMYEVYSEEWEWELWEIHTYGTEVFTSDEARPTGGWKLVTHHYGAIELYIEVWTTDKVTRWVHEDYLMLYAKPKEKVFDCGGIDNDSEYNT